MPSNTTISFYLATCLSAGVLSAFWLKPSLPVTMGILGLFILLLYFGIEKYPWRVYGVLAGMAFWALGMFSMAQRLPQNRSDHYLNCKESASECVRVRVIEELKPTTFSNRYLGEVISIGGHRREGLVLLQLSEDHLQIGQVILTYLFPQTVKPPLNPGQFDYGKYLRNQGVYGQIRLEKGVFIKTNPGWESLWAGVQRLRKQLMRRLDLAGFTPAELGIVKALLLGDRTGVDRDLNADYKKAGALHLLAVSGLHVGILSGLIHLLLSPLNRIRRGRSLKLVLGMALLWGYSFLAGFSPPVVRAVVLISAISYAFYLRRQGQTLHFLGLACIFMLALINPLWLFQVSFQLSFAAVAAIMVFYPVLFRWWPFKGFLVGYIGKLVCVSLSAQMGTLPLTLYYFNQFPTLFLLTSLVLLPLIGLILTVGFGCLFLEWFSILPSDMLQFYNSLLFHMNSFVHWIGSLENFHLEALPWDRVQLALSAIILFLTGLYFKRHSRVLLTGGAVILIALQGYGILQAANDAEINRWVVPHKVAHSGFWHQESTNLEVFSSAPDLSAGLLRDAFIHWRIRSVRNKGLQNYYRLGDLTLRIIDSTGIFSNKEPSPDFLILTGSPRIHLGRLIAELSPKYIIADGSNYHTQVRLWQSTCRRLDVRFHATAFNGAFVTDLPKRQLID